MWIYPLNSFIAVTLFSLVHLFASKGKKLDFGFQSRFLSVGSGIAIAYVFLDLLPKLSKNEPVVEASIRRFFPYFVHHVYIMALFGFLLFYVIDRSRDRILGERTYYYLSLGSYALFNMLVGYAVADKDNPEVKPLLLFSFAMSLHYFVNDYSLTKTLGKKYDHSAKYILIGALFFGWILGWLTDISAATVALFSAFIGGGVIMNVTRHELPLRHPNSLPAFLIATIIYSAILLMIGQ